MNIKKIGIVSFIFILNLYATDLTLNMGVGNWNPKLSGTTGTRVSPNYEIKDDYGISEKSDSTYLWVDYRHKQSFIPRYKFEISDLLFEGKTSKQIVLRDKTFSLNSESQLKIKQYDNIFYYSLFEDILTIDVGIDFKTFDGFMGVKGNNLEQKEDFDDTSALYYLAFSYSMDDLHFLYDIKYGIDGASKIQDQSIKAKYIALKSGILCLGVELGYKKQNIKVDDTSVSYIGDLDIEGLFAGLIAKF